MAISPTLDTRRAHLRCTKWSHHFCRFCIPPDAAIAVTRCDSSQLSITAFVCIRMMAQGWWHAVRTVTLVSAVLFAARPGDGGVSRSH